MFGILLSLKHELRVMSVQKSGNIMNISSTYGRQGAAYPSVYLASKHAVEGFSKSAALEAALSGVRDECSWVPSSADIPLKDFRQEEQTNHQVRTRDDDGIP